MACQRNRIPVSISAGAFLLGALLLLILPLKWLFAALCAALVHELCHLAAVKLTGGLVHEICIGRGGASIKIGPMDSGKELVCALSGPVGGLVLLLFVRWIPRIAICAAIHSVYNLLPIYPLDGGRALRCAAAMRLRPETGEKICDVAEKLCKTALIGLGIYATVVLKLGILPVLGVCIVLFKTKSGKIPCKLPVQRVQ